MRKAFICTNAKQKLGARLAAFAIARVAPNLPVEIIEVEERLEFRSFIGTRYAYDAHEKRSYGFGDLQSFTLTRFLPPELMGYEGQAIVIDPDIFALRDPNEAFAYLTDGAAIAACRKKNSWDTSVMILDCAKLRHWKMSDMLDSLRSGTRTYSDYMTLGTEQERIAELPRTWNSLDAVGADTGMLHTTNRLTQPWKTGLRVDFIRNRLPRLFDIIPREPLAWALGRYPMRYQPHPDAAVESYFFGLVRDALNAGIISREEIQLEIAQKNVRPDLLAIVDAR